MQTNVLIVRAIAFTFWVLICLLLSYDLKRQGYGYRYRALAFIPLLNIAIVVILFFRWSKHKKFSFICAFLISILFYYRNGLPEIMGVTTSLFFVFYFVSAPFLPQALKAQVEINNPIVTNSEGKTEEQQEVAPKKCDHCGEPQIGNAACKCGNTYFFT